MPSSILKNSLTVFGTRLGNGAAQLGVTLLIARAVDVPDYGRFAFGLAIGNLASVLSEGGTGLALVREVAAAPQRAGRYYATVLSLRLLAGSTVFVLGAALAYLLADPTLALATVLGLAIGLVRSLARHGTALCYGLERMEVETLSLGIESAATLGAVTAGVLLGAELPVLMLLLLAGYTLGFAVRSVAVGRLLRAPPLPGWDATVVRQVVRQVPAYGLFGVFAVVYAQADLPLVTFVLGEGAAGLFGAASKVFVFLMLLPEGVSNALLPAAARERALGSERLEGLAGVISYWIAAFALPLAVGGLLLARPLIVTLYGDAFAPASEVFAMLLLALPLRFHAFVQGTLLTADGAQGRRTRAMAVAAAVTVIGTLAGAYFGGVVGAAAARVLVEVTLVLTSGYGLGRGLARATFPSRLFRLLPGTAVMAGVVLATPDLHVLLRVALGAVAYVLASWLARAVTRRDLLELRGAP